MLFINDLSNIYKHKNIKRQIVVLKCIFPRYLSLPNLDMVTFFKYTLGNDLPLLHQLQSVLRVWTL